MTNQSISGIYKIENTINGKMYIGSACILKRRISKHKTELKTHTHCNQKLQRAWDKYGDQAFIFSVIEFVQDKNYLIQREQYWIDTLDSVSVGYNIASIAGSCLGIKKSLEVIEKTAAAHRGMKRGDATRLRIKEARAKQPPMSEDGRKRISAALRLRQPISDETRKKLSIANKGRIATPEAVEKNRLGHLGKKQSIESIAKSVAARAGFRHSEESKAKMSEWQIGRKMSPESVAKSVANRVLTDDGREKIAAAGRATKGRKKPDGFAKKQRDRQISIGWKPSEKMIEASRKARVGKKFSAEVIAKRVATRKRNAESKRQTEAKK